ncbi:MAG: hypothetical protein HUJ31_14585 [Pseudomonadales bacterium]|nr:hypothetical protein [Pseudomonadales bacterium]
MRIERLWNDQSEFRCFELDNRMISRNGIAEVLKRLEGVEIVHEPRFYDDEVFCEFTFRDKLFQATEPYGDSSTYDIVGPEGAQLEMEALATHFELEAPIQSGDTPHQIFFIVNWIASSLLIAGILIAVYKVFVWVGS